MKILTSANVQKLVALAVLSGALLAGVVGSQALAQPGGTPPAFRPPASPTAQSALVPHPDAALGYTISLPPSYRLALSNVNAQNTGVDFFSPRSATEDSQLCARERGGDVQSPERVADVRVAVSSNPTNLTPVAFASQPNRTIAFTSVVATSVGGLDAAKIVHQPSGDTAYYVISANGRLYEIAPLTFEQPTTQPKGWVDQIALSFRAIPTQPVVNPAPPRPLCG
jgi:hypothetical protein